ncbi:MAG: hypothetical protein QOG63_2263 [Thermoleophilaceae bacterium]|jgi:hypothetical protein|nr:hypothetical protein [Thermoleophilaceae bacterium]
MAGEQNGGGPRKRRSTVHPLDIARLHPAESRSDRLATLEELRERGVLSDAEYVVQRDEIVDEI